MWMWGINIKSLDFIAPGEAIVHASVSCSIVRLCSVLFGDLAAQVMTCFYDDRATSVAWHQMVRRNFPTDGDSACAFWMEDAEQPYEYLILSRRRMGKWEQVIAVVANIDSSWYPSIHSWKQRGSTWGLPDPARSLFSHQATGREGDVHSVCPSSRRGWEPWGLLESPASPPDLLVHWCIDTASACMHKEWEHYGTMYHCQRNNLCVCKEWNGMNACDMGTDQDLQYIQYIMFQYLTEVLDCFTSMYQLFRTTNKNTSLEEWQPLGKVIARVYEDRFANWASHLVLAMASYEPAWKWRKHMNHNMNPSSLDILSIPLINIDPESGRF